MTVIRTPSGRFCARLKNGRQFVASKTFDTRREAVAWLARERAAMAGGVDPRAGRQQMKQLVDQWLDVRKATVAQKTFRADQDVRRLTPASVQALQIGVVSDREISRIFAQLLTRGLSEASVVRYRASLSSFFAWCVVEKLILRNPVTGVKVPYQSEESAEMLPFSEDELEAAYMQWRDENARLADIFLVFAWTGLRWAEARSITVGDVMRVPSPALLVRHSDPEGVGRKRTKGRRSRRVPLANRVLPIVEGFMDGKRSADLLFTTQRGAKLHRSAVLRSIQWKESGQGRRIHDLRHTAACLWLARGVDVGTVQAWMGHESIATTNRYLHHLGTGADSAGLERLNSPRGYAGGTPPGREAD